MISRLLASHLTVIVFFGAASASAQTITSENWSEVRPGIRLLEGTTSSPTTRFFAAFIDVCTEHVHIDATPPPSSFQTPAAWGSSVGAQLAVNGDFFRSGPLVYGQAVGGGVPWPDAQTGYVDRHGWLAFGPGWIEFNHTKYVKEHPEIFDASRGWSPTEVTYELPPDTIGLVSGFPELVTEGRVYTCPEPTNSCFPDRGDMDDRHPRTAMGISDDYQTFILLVVDGRSSVSAGMRGVELASLIHQLGAWQAFNIDGGGSSSMWIEGRGTINDPSDGVPRAVANHWGVFAGEASGRPAEPGSCVDPRPCDDALPPEGGTVDDTSGCFQAFGPQQYWRRVDGEGEGGSLLWTNAFESDHPSNWARWRFSLEEAGRYRVAYHSVAEWAVHDAARYRVVHANGASEVVIDQGGRDGWVDLGEYDFPAGMGPSVSVFDNSLTPIASEQHIVVDAIRLTRLDEGAPTDPPPPEATVDGGGRSAADGGMAGGEPTAGGRGASLSGGCSAGGSGPASYPMWLVACLIIGGLIRRRERQ